MIENGDEATQLHDLDLQQEWVFKQALIPCSTTQVFQQRMNTFSNHSHNQIKDQHTNVFMWFVVVVVVGERAPKKLFSHKKKISLLDDNKG